MNKSSEIAELAKALSKAQGVMTGAKADSKNPFFKSNYADLASVWEAAKEPLSKNGLSVVQTTIPHDNKVEVETTLLHDSGQFITSSLSMPAEKLDAQSFGKLITYCRRYALAAMVGISQVDDYGNSASKLGETSPNPLECQHEFLTSKFNKDEEYCKLCKFKRSLSKKGSA